MTATGKRSPRWAFMSRMHLTKNGRSYLRRLRILETPWFGVFLHHIDSVDEDPDPHDHPWSFVSLVLRGRYHEWVWPMAWDAMHTREPEGKECFESSWGRGSLHRMGRHSAHTIVGLWPGTVTLVIHGRRNPQAWGFWSEGGFVPWHNYSPSTTA